MLRADHEHALGTSLEKSVGRSYGVHETAARGVQVHGGAVEAKLVGDRGGGRGNQAVGGCRREHEEVDVLRLDSRVLECAASGEHAKTAGCATNATLTYAGALGDPLVGRIQRERQLVVRNDPVWYRDTPANKSSAHVQAPSSALLKSLEVGLIRALVLAKPAMYSVRRR